LDFGIWKNKGVSGHQIRAAVDILESRGYLKILLNPTLDTVNGKMATVQIRDRSPIEVTVTEKTGDPYKLTQYEWVADTLTVTPSVYADGFIGLKTSIVIGSKSKPEGVVQTPILTQRSIDVAENRIEPGKSLIIGGMRKSENRSVVRGVPFFKDLPLIGPLFSSKDFEENATEIVYILTPSISSGGVEYSEMADSLRKKYAGFSSDPNTDAGAAKAAAGGSYTQFVEAKSAEAARETIRLQRDAKRAEFEAREERLRAERAMLESKVLQAQAEQAKAQYEQSVAQINAAKAQAEASAKEAAAQKAFISMTTEEIQKAAAAAQAAQAAAQKANAEFEAARQKTQKMQEEAEKAKARYDALQAEIEKINQTQPQKP
jgi:flagellar biosynthesis GTPase FlhF